MGEAMASHVDILDERVSLRRPLAGSIAAHAALFGSLIGYHWAGTQGGILWGTPHSLGGGGSVAITPIRQIPLPARSGRVNPVAHDTESRVPAPPKPAAKKSPREPDRDAIEIPSRKSAKLRTQIARRQSSYRPPAEERPHQLYSQAGQALASPLFGAQMGTGGVGLGPSSAFGSRYGWYRDLIEQRIAQKWRTEEVDPRVQTAPPVIVIFDILRKGQIRGVAILQSSGNRALDYSAQRAVFEAGPLPPLPAGFDREEARIEIWFQLKR